MLSGAGRHDRRDPRSQRAGRRPHRRLAEHQAAGHPVPRARSRRGSGRAATAAWREVVELRRPARSASRPSCVLWLPFIPSGGPAGYLANLGHVPERDLQRPVAAGLERLVAAPGGRRRRRVHRATTSRSSARSRCATSGYLVTGLISLVIGWRIIRDPRPRTLVLGLAASVLVFFSFMTQMHERYAYAALILLVLLLPERRIGWLWVGAGGRVHAQPRRRHPAEPGDRGDDAGGRRPGRGRLVRLPRPDGRAHRGDGPTAGAEAGRPGGGSA